MPPASTLRLVFERADIQPVVTHLSETLMHELKVAESLAREAGAAALRFYDGVSAEYKEGGSPVTAADHAANDVIVAGLRRAFPGDALLSEESKDSADRLSARRVWVVDPLDGTKEFLARNGEFSIMIGLSIEGEAVLGVVYLPDGDVLYSAARGQGAWADDGVERRRLERGPRTDDLRLVGSRSHSDPLLERMREELGITDVVPCGSVGVKCSRIVEDLRDLYVHPVPYLKEWDTCAPEVLVREAGGWVSDCMGRPLRYNKPDPRQPHGILASAPGASHTHEPIIRLYRESITPAEAAATA